jgi:hypothetical protein
MFAESRSRVQKYLGCLMGFLLCCHLSYAAPDLQTATSFGDVKVFRDHMDTTIFYYQKSQKKIVDNAGVPDFSYHINRYIGTGITGDSDAFRVRGAIKFQATTSSDISFAELNEKIRTTYKSSVKLMPAPVVHSFNKLIYETVSVKEGEEKVTGSLESGFTTEEKSKNSIFGVENQRFTIPLSGHDANFFWDSFEQNNLVLSLSYGWSVKGVKKNAEDKWEDAVYEINNAEPIRVSMKEYPDLFRKNELWQKLDVAHSSMTVMCYDFINLKKTNLYSVLVELKFQTLRNQSYVEKVKFSSNKDTYEVNVKFKLANSTKDGYEYRVTRLTIDGDKTISPWKKATETGLDVSLSSAEIELYKLEETESDDEML